MHVMMIVSPVTGFSFTVEVVYGDYSVIVTLTGLELLPAKHHVTRAVEAGLLARIDCL